MFVAARTQRGEPHRGGICESMPLLRSFFLVAFKAITMTPLWGYKTRASRGLVNASPWWCCVLWLRSPSRVEHVTLSVGLASIQTPDEPCSSMSRSPLNLKFSI